MVTSPPLRSLLTRFMRNVILFATVLTLLRFAKAEDMDSTGKRVTFYPSSLMISHNVRPLIFFSETKLMYLTTKLKAVSSGPPITITNNCSATYNAFFTSLLKSIQGTQKVMTRLLSLSSFSNLLECDSYLRRYFQYATGLPSRMVCPRHYQPTLAACKAWAL